MDKELEEAIEFAISENKRKQKIVDEARLNNRFTAFYQDLQKKIDNEEILLNYIENSIPTKKVEDKIEELNDIKSEYSQRVIHSKTSTFTELAQEILKELLEDK